MSYRISKRDTDPQLRPQRFNESHTFRPYIWSLSWLYFGYIIYREHLIKNIIVLEYRTIDHICQRYSIPQNFLLRDGSARARRAYIYTIRRRLAINTHKSNEIIYLNLVLAYLFCVCTIWNENAHTRRKIDKLKLSNKIFELRMYGQVCNILDTGLRNIHRSSIFT